MGGSGEGIVLAVGPDTVYGGFSGMISQRKNKFDQGAASIARVLLRFMGVLIPIVFVACGLTKGNWAAAFLFALSVAVGLTPEMLPMVINACLAKGSASMGKKQTVVKKHSRHAGLWKHGRTLRRQNRNVDGRYNFAGILYGYPWE